MREIWIQSAILIPKKLLAYNNFLLWNCHSSGSYCVNFVLIMSKIYRRPHQSLASVGAAALVRLALSTGSRMSPESWQELLRVLDGCAKATLPDIESLVSSLSERRTSVDSMPADDGDPESAWSIQSPSHSPRALLNRNYDRQASDYLSHVHTCLPGIAIS